MASGRWTTGLQMDGTFTCTTICAKIHKLQVCIKGGLPCTDYCQCVRELCANWPSHEMVGSGSDYDTDSDDSDVD